MVTVDIVTIGDELNRGEIIDTNSSWLAERLTALGAYVRWRTSVTDDPADMATALRQAAGRADVVVCSGGLGPTDDDRTVDVVAKLIGVEPVQEAAHEEKMRARFAERGFRLTPNNTRQVRVPAGATVLNNAVGQAPGFGVQLDRAWLYFMPGVPREMKPMFDSHLAPRVAKLVGVGMPAKRTWRVTGMGESHVDHALTGLIDGLEDVTLHYRIAFPENLVTVIVRRSDEAEAQRVIETLDREVRARLAGHVYATGDTTLAAAVGERLVARGATVAVAESCTGGLVGQLLTATAGSSKYFVGGVIAYSNDVKRDLLGVSDKTLAADGAVSEATVIEMADGARARTGATWAIAVSGIAGPDGGTAEKPVGTVFIAIAREGAREVRKLFWPGERELVRQLSAHAALHLLFKQLSDA
ncbi:MAG: competence/damage-inducible protein CinA [Myxococcales bacterium]|nr:competence/damage-inducible protein CinA [Myxococcales bacterium]